jgi:hypothetical protein
MKRETFFAIVLGMTAFAGVGCGDDDDGDDDDGGGGTGGGSMNVECTPGGGGACQNDDDCPIVESGTARGEAQDCGLDCQDNSDPGTCTVTCIVTNTGLTPDCSTCYAALVGCVAEHCLGQCSTDPNSTDCVECQIDEGCRSTFDACSGLDTIP